MFCFEMITVSVKAILIDKCTDCQSGNLWIFLSLPVAYDITLWDILLAMPT